MEGFTYSIKKTTALVGIAGVYKIWFKGTNNFYIGSSNNLSKRLCYHRTRLRRGVHDNPCLTNAINKYGIDNCFVEIMKVCDVKDIITYEQHFIDSLKPEYNIAKAASGGPGSKLSNEDILKIRHEYFSREYQEDLKDIADKYKVAPNYIKQIATSSNFSHIKNPPDLQEFVNTNKGRRVPRREKKTSVRGYIQSPMRKLTAEQVGMIRWALANDKSATILLKKLGITTESGSAVSRIRKGTIYKEYQDLVDASHFNLPPAQRQKLTAEDIPKIRWAHQQGIPHNEIVRVFGCHFNTSCDIKMGRVYKTITAIEPCEHLFNQ